MVNRTTLQITLNDWASLEVIKLPVSLREDAKKFFFSGPATKALTPPPSSSLVVILTKTICQNFLD